MSKIVEIPNNQLYDEVKELIKEGHTVTIRVKGNSMMPLLHDKRDSVVLTSCKKPHRGMIILAEISPKNYVLHRIIQIDGDRITLMGDGNISGVEYCRTKDIVAVTTQIIRNNKTLAIRGAWWKTYSSFWLHCLPLRHIMLIIYGWF